MRGKSRPPYLQPRECIPVAIWPHQDQAAWAKAIAFGSPLEPGGWASSWAPRSRYKAAVDYGHWLGWLERQAELDLTSAPELRATRDRVGRYLKDLQSRLSSFTVQIAVAGPWRHAEGHDRDPSSSTGSPAPLAGCAPERSRARTSARNSNHQTSSSIWASS